MSEIRYRYVEQNRLEHRYHYHYTPFEGSEFLDAYRASRLDWIEQLVKHFSITKQELEQLYGIAKDLGSSFGTFVPTRDLLNGVLGNPSCDTSLPDANHALDEWRPLDWIRQHLRERLDGQTFAASDRETLDRLVQRFEVTKRIYGSYDQRNKPIDRRYEDPLSYALLAFICLDEYHARPNLKYLNVALKLIDLLASLPADAIEQFVAPVCVVLAHFELSCLESMIREHGAA